MTVIHVPAALKGKGSLKYRKTKPDLMTFLHKLMPG